MALTVEQSARLTQIRGLILGLGGQPLTEEQRKALVAEGVTIMRQDRKAAQASSTTSRTKAADARTPVDTGSILASLKAKGAALQGAVISPAGDRNQS